MLMALSFGVLQRAIAANQGSRTQTAKVVTPHQMLEVVAAAAVALPVA